MLLLYWTKFTTCYIIIVRREHKRMANMINKKLKHYEVTYNGVVIKTFDNYTQFYNWLESVDCWGVRDFGNDTGIIKVEPINKSYLQKLNIIKN